MDQPTGVVSNSVGSATSNTATLTVTTTVTDTSAPSIPAGLSASTVSRSQINLTWSASSDNVGVVGYTVYRNGVKVATVLTTSYQDSGLSALTSYTYAVSAYDAAGNVSGKSQNASATTYKFSIGDVVHVTTNHLKVRSSAGGTWIGTQRYGATGTVVAGPTNANGYTYWKVDYTSGVDGWSAQDWLSQ